jgi:hypothetical protein
MTVIEIPYDKDNVPHPLGRAMVNHDPLNLLFRALTAPTRPKREANLPWSTFDVYDQISDDCTANAAVGVLRTSPHYPLIRPVYSQYDSQQDKVALYKEAQHYDPWEGNDYAGSSTDAPFKVLRLRGVIPGWQWLFGPEEVQYWLHHYGPVAVGTSWYNDMFYPDSKGYISPGGSLAGGHAYRLVYHSPKRGYRVVNSWSRSWGQSGRAWLSDADMADLLADFGEAVTL